VPHRRSGHGRRGHRKGQDHGRGQRLTQQTCKCQLPDAVARYATCASTGVGTRGTASPDVVKAALNMVWAVVRAELADDGVVVSAV
jgi:hypothetical protein